VRVLHVHSGNIMGGIETMLVTLAREQRRQRIDPLQVALCFSGAVADALAAAGASVSIIGAVRLSRLGTVRRGRSALRALLQQVNPDVVLVHQPWTQAIFGGTVKRLGYPLVTWMHAPAQGWLSRAAALHHPAAIVCNSTFTAASIPRAYRFVPHAVIHCPSEPPDGALRAARRQTRHAMGCTDEEVVIAQVSRMEAWKGHEIHLRALGRLREVPRWVAWFVGGAQRQREAAYERTLRALAADLGIGNRVSFLGQREDVPRLLAAADLYCQPNTEAEPFGLSYVEALAAGLPIVATGIGGAVEIVTADTGVLVPGGDVDALESVLRRLIQDRSQRERLGRNGPARAAAVSDPARQLEAMATFLRRFEKRAA
jgi:glycosyltransferase involved in cell wall biosynthesis